MNCVGVLYQKLQQRYQNENSNPRKNKPERALYRSAVIVQPAAYLPVCLPAQSLLVGMCHDCVVQKAHRMTEELV